MAQFEGKRPTPRRIYKQLSQQSFSSHDKAHLRGCSSEGLEWPRDSRKRDEAQEDYDERRNDCKPVNDWRNECQHPKRHDEHDQPNQRNNDIHKCIDSLI